MKAVYPQNKPPSTLHKTLFKARIYKKKKHLIVTKFYSKYYSYTLHRNNHSF